MLLTTRCRLKISLKRKLLRLKQVIPRLRLYQIRFQHKNSLKKKTIRKTRKRKIKQIRKLRSIRIIIMRMLKTFPKDICQTWT